MKKVYLSTGTRFRKYKAIFEKGDYSQPIACSDAVPHYYIFIVIFAMYWSPPNFVCRKKFGEVVKKLV